MHIRCIPSVLAWVPYTYTAPDPIYARDSHTLCTRLGVTVIEFSASGVELWVPNLPIIDQVVLIFVCTNRLPLCLYLQVLIFEMVTVFY